MADLPFMPFILRDNLHHDDRQKMEFVWFYDTQKGVSFFLTLENACIKTFWVNYDRMSASKERIWRLWQKKRDYY